jgi:hypothetical protein
VTVKFTFLKKTQQWAVIGPIDEIKLGPAHVTTHNGETRTERVIKVTRSFDTSNGPCCYGIIAVLPKGRV